jgi:5-methylcytosine-specific restriction enzyme A
MFGASAMPTRAKRLCPRCGEPFAGRRCATCEQRWRYKTQLRSDALPNPYESTEWRLFSRRFLVEHPTCECVDCALLPAWRRPRSQVTDHVDGLGPLGPRGFDPTNMQAMTIACHARKTIKHDGGFGRPVARLTTRPDDPGGS